MAVFVELRREIRLQLKRFYREMRGPSVNMNGKC